MAYYEGIEKLEKTVEGIKDIINKQLTAMDVIDNPMNAVMAKVCFDLLESYVEIEKNNQEWHERINEKLENNKMLLHNLNGEMEWLIKELEKNNKES